MHAWVTSIRYSKLSTHSIHVLFTHSQTQIIAEHSKTNHISCTFWQSDGMRDPAWKRDPASWCGIPLFKSGIPLIPLFKSGIPHEKRDLKRLRSNPRQGWSFSSFLRWFRRNLCIEIVPVIVCPERFSYAVSWKSVSEFFVLGDSAQGRLSHSALSGLLISALQPLENAEAGHAPRANLVWYVP